MIRLFIFAGLVTVSLGTYRNPEPPTPQCGPNEVYSDKKQVCPPQSCESIYTTYLCANGEPEPGCNCINGYLRNADNVCIPSDQCEIPGGAPVPVDASPKPKPCPKACKGDPNATSKKCPNPCAPTCKNPVSSTPCTKMCLASGCECNDGYIIGPNGKCVLPENCPAGCNGDRNAIVKSCPNPCPQTCENPDSGPCYAACIKFGCECKAGYVLSDKGKCIPLKQCPVKTCNRDPNAEFRSCRGCDGTCANPNPICTAQCRPGGCQCKRGYVRHNGKCILPENCPATCKDPNEEFRECTGCEGSCDNPNPICTADCKPPGCQCKSGYVRSNGKCILQESCPATCKDPNEEFRDCTGCEGSCDNPSPICTAVCRPPGCQCKSGYVRSNGKCILKKNCPVKPGCRGDPNAILKKCPNPCPATCDNPKPTGPCPRLCVQTGCECKKGYVLSPDGKCILLKNCPAPALPECGENEIATNNRTICPPQSCEISYTTYLCEPQPAEPGCDCIDGYLRNSDGVCIPSDECPPPTPVLPECGENEIPTNNRTICPPQSCEISYTTYLCEPQPAEPGCDCIDGYLRNSDGVCIPSDQCPPSTPVLPECGENEIPTNNRTICPPQSCEISYTTYLCEPQPAEPGCDCIDGYLRNSDGVCIPSDQCPPPTPVLPECGENEIATNNRTICPPQSCEIIYTTYACEPQPAEPGCDCIDGYLRNSDGVCIPNDQCPIPEPPQTCGYNEVFSPNKRSCPPETCESLYQPPYPCAPPHAQPPTPGCVCLSGHLRDSNGICIPKEQCPPPSTDKPPQTCGYNEVFTPNKRTCPPETCETLYRPPYPCARPNPQNMKPGCECLPGHLRNSNGICIPKEQCPPPSTDKPTQTCGKNEVFTPKKRSCPPETCESLYQPPYPCPPPGAEELLPGCECLPGYLRDTNGVCIPKEQCPPPVTCAENEVYLESAISCPPDTCDTLYVAYSCAAPPEGEKPPPGCRCKNNYLRNSKGVCIPQDQCPPLQTVVGCGGDENASWSDCTSACPPTCDNPNPICTQSCQQPGCQCNPGYLLFNSKCILPENCPATPKCPIARNCRPTCAVPNPPNCAKIEPVANNIDSCLCQGGYVLSEETGKCVRIEDCPKQKSCNGDPHAVIRACPLPCPPTCANPDIKRCNKGCQPIGCECKSGYILSKENGKCILADACPGGNPCGINSTFVDCAFICPNEAYCPREEGVKFSCNAPPYPCPPGCVCKENYKKLIGDGRCVLKSDCPKLDCNDPNAEVTKCPNPCPATCENPEPGVCNKLCLSTGCQCKPGYILSKGKCVLPKDCPGGVSCPANEQYVFCKADCPTSFCPENDSRAIIMCDPPFPCPSGCSCKAGFLRKSQKDKRCIEASKCPPVKCTRPNEVWSSDPPNCLAERCEDYISPPGPCNKPYRDYTPKCICKKGYYRNSDDVCVPAKECAPKCPIPPRCRQTCAVPNPSKCPVVKPATTNVDGCQCKEGYVLEKEGGPCIKIEDCPPQNSCNGDPNAVVVPCPWACQPTCKNPEAALCKAMCMPVGCNCKPGYIRSKENGKCILPDTCPGGNPCGKNGKFLECGFRCPNQYCPEDDSGVKYACKPGRPCPPGCGCKDNYKRLSLKDETCVLASDCPIIQCTRPNEVWSKCPSDCLAESCDNVNDPQPVCDTPLCEPKCVCQQGYYRNTAGECVPAQDCPGYNPCASSCTPTCANPNPPNCDPYLASTCCESGYVLSEKGGKCIKIEDCPRNGCNGDPNAIVKQCPAPCPSTCDSPNAFPCRKACKNIGCECAPGYLFNKEEKCVLPEQCPGGNPCRNNERFVTCKVPCPTDYCPTSDTRAVVACDPPFPCLSGCVCNLNYRRKSVDDDRCIVASDCPPVKCTRPNEVWSPCPSDCSSEYCDAVDQPPVVCNTLLLNCQPRCVCKKNYYRNTTDICISAHECRQSTNPPNSDCEE